MKYLQVCRVLYDYEARTTDEINIKENDTLYVIGKEDEDWWKAELKQVSTDEPVTIGLVPATYLEEVAPIGRVQAEYDYEAQQEEELSFGEGQTMWLLERDDPDWYLVKLDNGDIGLAPANYVQDIDQQHPDTGTSSPTLMDSNSSPSVVPTMHTRQSTLSNATNNEDEAQSWTVHEYDRIKKKKKKGKGNLMIGNALLCYGSETDKTSPVQQYSILNVVKYLIDGKNIYIDIDAPNPTKLELQATSKSEAKAILGKIIQSHKAAEVAGTRIIQQEPVAATPIDDNPVTHDISSTPSEPKWAISLYTFDAVGGEEISISENQQILVTDYNRNDGWWRVETIDGSSGVIPSSYVQFYDDDHNATLAADDNNEVVDSAAHDEVEAYLQEQEKRKQQEALQQQQQIEQLDQIEKQRKMDQSRRDDEERERRRKVQEAAQLAEMTRQRQAEEDRRRRESNPRSLASPNSNTGHSNARPNLPKPDPDRLRTWTDRSGSFKVEAQFLAYVDGKLRLHKSNGVKIDVPLEKMSAEDIRWVERRTDQPVGSTMKSTNNNNNVEKTPEMPPRPNPNRSNDGSTRIKKTANSNWDWFDWFLTIGIPMQEALVYSSAFKADNLDDSDLTILTHKQMKMLGMKEKHVQRMERYIDSGKVEPPSDNENDSSEQNDLERKKQIESDEEMARRLQKSWTDGATNNESSSRSQPSVSAPKEIHPDLLEFLGSDPTSSSNNEPSQRPGYNNDLIGFSDDAWALRPTTDSSQSKTSPLLQPQTAAPSTQNINTTTLSPTPAAPVSQQSTSMQPKIQSPQHQQSISRTIDPSLIPWQSTSTSSSSSSPNGITRPSLNQLSQQEELRKHQQQQRQQALLEQQQQLIMQQQQQIQQQQQQQIQLQQSQLQQSQLQQSQLQQSQLQQSQLQQSQLQQFPLMTGYQQSNGGLILFNNGAPHQQQPQMTGYLQEQQLPPQMTGYSQQYQATGYVPQQPTNSMMMMNTTGLSSAAGQHPGAQTLQPQTTGRHWNASTPDNPFGSPVQSQSLGPQMTGAVQFSVPHPNTFTQSPTQPPSSSPAYLQQLQPQMTGIQQTELSGARDKYAPFKTPNADIFTPSGSLKYGQSGFTNPQGY
ncbi:hypothetical protein BC941DRAFT_498554 [Chlamydoabsidia padenii]|nr:hypothetical protein BC941DRAFT_498554 [Chlamydoabsidia padenii]